MPGGLLPPSGSKIACSCSALQVPLDVDVLGTFHLDFRGGLEARIEASPGPGGGVRLRVVAYQMSAVSPALGRVFITRADIDLTPVSLLELLESSPPVYCHTLFLDFHLMIERPPSGGRPLVLSNIRTARLQNNRLTAFPPQDALYQLQEPVSLAPVSVPGHGIARLTRLPVTLSRLPTRQDDFRPSPFSDRRGRR